MSFCADFCCVAAPAESAEAKAARESAQKELNKQVLVECAEIKKQYMDNWKTWKAEAKKRKEAVLSAWDHLHTEMKSGVAFDMSVMPQHLQRYVADSNDWINKSLAHFTWVNKKIGV